MKKPLTSRADFLRAVRAEAALTAYRTALDWVRHKSHEELERRLLDKIQEKRIVLYHVASLRAKARIASADAEYHAQADLIDNDHD